ncbi:MAG: 6-phosphogluconolactonase [Gammaproteobacteria bacterium]|nr:6-phosphogluconolactonase [Gammaproteobacteria bacterium]
MAASAIGDSASGCFTPENTRVFKDAETVAQAAADYVFEQINKCVTEKGQCHVVLPGGTTPARCLELLANKPLPWAAIHWYPGDERCYPVGHAERNDTMIFDKLLSSQPGLNKNFHPIPAELGPEQGAEDYAAILDATDGMDVVVLGMGEDGHTASLFPNNIALHYSNSAVPVYNSPKPPDERVSIGLNTLKNSAECIVVATGEGKRDALQKLRQGETLPVGLVEPDVWFVDEDAVRF